VQADRSNPNETKKPNQPAKTNERNGAVAKESAPIYFYTFAQPNFTVSRIFIEHDEAGAGKISFEKKNFGDLIVEPLQLSQRRSNA
jgi:hypothetical protein